MRCVRRLRFITAALIAAGLLTAALPDAPRADTGVAVTPRPMPEFPHSDPAAWVNSAPIRLADLHGKVVLLDIWTTV